MTWPLFFRIAALFNFGAAGAFLLAPDVLYQLLLIEKPIAPPARLYSDAFAVMAGIFGLGYWWVAADPASNRNLIWLGVIGKTAIVLVFWMHALFADAPLNLAPLISVDILFAGAFAYYLRQQPPP